ncbi:MFS transporter [Sphingomonas sp. KC8]|uniref:MFS transporter n=1 Tax=Sphingomonas sp. KC8 TaxID=1030157 RepID=UPI0002489C7F|nr:MFS transporter [Sphingomonas sp. KC8]ARS27254.1 hypothetical protein KC8_08110 [Sphingomonas sp. KC8]
MSTASPAIDGRYKWVILAAVFIAQMMAIGATSFGYGLFVKPVIAEFGMSRGNANLGLMLIIVGMALVSPLVGQMLDRFPARWTVIGGGALFGIGAAIVAMTSNLWVLAAAIFLPLAVGTTALGPLTASTLVARWFDERRGRALGIVAISSSTGGLLVVPAMAALIEQFGWRGAVAITGFAVAMVATLIGLFVIRERTVPVVGSAETPAMAAVGRWTARQLIGTRDFWLLVLSVGVLMGVSQALLSSLVAYGTDRGFSLAQATALVLCVSASSIAGKLVIGMLADSIDKRWLLAGVALLLELFLVILMMHPVYPALVAGCLAAGAAVGGTYPVWAALISSRFGIASFGMVMGLTVQFQMPIILGSLRFVGDSFDRTGSYDQAFAAFAILAPIAFLAALAIGRPGMARL